MNYTATGRMLLCGCATFAASARLAPPPPRANSDTSYRPILSLSASTSCNSAPLLLNTINRCAWQHRVPASRPSERRVVPAAAAAEGEVNPVLVEQLEASGRELDAIVREVLQQASVEKAVSQMTGDSMDVSELEVVQRAVESRLEGMNDTFLAALNAYLVEAEKLGDQFTIRLLLAIREAVLQALSRRLPPELQLLEALLQAESSASRVARMQLAARGGDGDLPGCELGPAISAATQFIDDIEDNAEIPDKRMLARLCVIREELQNVDRQARWEASGDARDRPTEMGVRGSVPQMEVALLKELLNVPDKPSRLAFIKKAFRDGWSPGARSHSGDATPKAVVRPGRFMTCLSTTQGELQGDAACASEALLARLEDVRREALVVLAELAETEEWGP